MTENERDNVIAREKDRAKEKERERERFSPLYPNPIPSVLM